MAKRELTRGTGATNWHDCPHCGARVGNVSTGGKKTANWIVYDMARSVCTGVNFIHYRWQGNDFLWFNGELSTDCGQLRMEI